MHIKLFLLFFLILSQLKGEITYELKDPAYCYTIMEVPVDFCSLSARLTKWLTEVETSKVIVIPLMPIHPSIYLYVLLALDVNHHSKAPIDIWWCCHAQCFQARQLKELMNQEFQGLRSN